MESTDQVRQKKELQKDEKLILRERERERLSERLIRYGAEMVRMANQNILLQSTQYAYGLKHSDSVNMFKKTYFIPP